MATSSVPGVVIVIAAVEIGPAPSRYAAATGASPYGGGGGAWLTVTTTAFEVVVLPAASRATAVTVWLPSATVVEFQMGLKGGGGIFTPVCAAAAQQLS